MSGVQADRGPQTVAYENVTFTVRLLVIIRRLLDSSRGTSLASPEQL